MRPTPTMPTRAFSPFIGILCHAFVTGRALYPRFEPGSERLARIRQLSGLNRYAALDQPPRHRDLTLGIDAAGVSQPPAVELEQERGARSERPPHTGSRLRDGPAHALDVHVVLLRPKRGHRIIGNIAAGGIAADDRAMLLRMAPVLQPYEPARSRKARAVAGREDRRIAGAALTIDNDAVLHGDTGLLRQPIVGRDPGPDDDEIGGNRAAALGIDCQSSVRQLAQGRRRDADPQIDAAHA